jgi:hypothetical protein
MTTTTTARTNTYGAKCTDCGVWVAPGAGSLSGSRGAWITRHIGDCPSPAATPARKDAEPGYYVLADGTAIKVQQNRAKTHTYGKRLTFHGAGRRPSWDYAPGIGLSVADLTPMTAGDAAALGLSHGHCIVCLAPLGGATMSAAVSALIGYGETCARNNGWTYPKGVKAQREFIAAHA